MGMSSKIFRLRCDVRSEALPTLRSIRGAPLIWGCRDGRPIERRDMPGIHDVCSFLSAREILAACGGNERSRFGGTIPFCRRPKPEAAHASPEATQGGAGGSPAKAANRCAHRIGEDVGEEIRSSGSVAERATDAAKRSAARRVAEGRRARRGAVPGATAYLWHARGGHMRSCECHRVGDSRGPDRKSHNYP
jgi:hypothetical protein